MEQKLPSTPAVLDEIKNFVRGHQYNVSDNKARITLYNNAEYTLESVPDPEPGTVPHIGMYNEWRALSFENVSELKGWLRCHRTEHMEL